MKFRAIWVREVGSYPPGATGLTANHRIVPTSPLGVEMNVKTIRKNCQPVPALIVFGSAAYQSFWHSVHVASAHGAQDPWLLPISIDGVMLVAARYVSHARSQGARWLSLGVFILGAIATLMVNFLAAPPGDLIGQCVAVWPALGMLLTAALLHWAPQRPVVARRRAPAKPKNVISLRARKAS